MALEQGSLRDFLFGPSHSAAAPAVARYQIENGGSSFVLDTASGRSAFLKFEGSGEVWALHATPGPRGDVIYKNDIDEPVVRATHLGGVTLFTPDQPEGMPAAFMGQAAPPHMSMDIGPEALWNIFVQSSARASHMAEHLVVFEGPQDITTASAPVFADAAILTSQALYEGRLQREGRESPDRPLRQGGVRRRPGRGCDGPGSGGADHRLPGSRRGGATFVPAHRQRDFT